MKTQILQIYSILLNLMFINGVEGGFVPKIAKVKQQEKKTK